MSTRLEQWAQQFALKGSMLAAFKAKTDVVHVCTGYLSVNSPELIFDLVNAKPGTNHSTNPTNPNGNSKW